MPGERSNAVHQALHGIRTKAAEWRAFADESRARALEWAADTVENALRSADAEVLPLDEAAERSGYSEEHLARLVRTGRIPDMRKPGSRGRIYIRISDLPTRLPQAHTPSADVHELASRLLGGRKGHHGHP